MGMIWTKQLGYVDSNMQLSDTHGGHEGLHLIEFEHICNSIVDRKLQQVIPEIQQSAYNAAIQALVSALQVDVETIVSIQLAQGEQIFHDSRTKTVLMQAVMNEIKKNLQTKYTIK